MGNKLDELKREIKKSIEIYFEDKIGDANFSNFEDVKCDLEKELHFETDSIMVNLDCLDSTIDYKLEKLEDDRNYAEACERIGVRPGYDI